MIRVLIIVAVAIVFLVIGFALGTLFDLSGLGLPNFAAFFVAGLFFGVVLGFILDWLIEEAVRRNRELVRQMDVVQQSAGQLSGAAALNLPAMTISGEGDEIASQTLADFLRKRDEEVKQLQAELEQTEGSMDSLRQEFDAYVKTHPDNLTVIKGIGQVYQRKLRDIGINTYRQLADADKEWLHRMLDIKEWQQVNIESWINQARDWTQRG
ncbi:MAG: hypothetical protein ACE5H9_10750 [Anaerolineae bacterium]